MLFSLCIYIYIYIYLENSLFLGEITRSLPYAPRPPHPGYQEASPLSLRKHRQEVRK